MFCDLFILCVCAGDRVLSGVEPVLCEVHHSLRAGVRPTLHIQDWYTYIHTHTLYTYIHTYTTHNYMHLTYIYIHTYISIFSHSYNIHTYIHCHTR